MKRPKVIYITGFRQHAGKTITALGLLSLLQKKYPSEELGYMKPVGQELVPLEDGMMIDKDARILQEFSGIPDLDPRVVSPVRLGSGFTKEFLDSPNRKAEEEKLTRKVLDSVEALSHKKIIVAEGTGHPGVGGIVGLSNARVAEILGAEVVFLSGGGIGKALDMLEVDLHYFMCQGVNVRGVIFNKLIPSKIDQVRHYITEKLLQERFPFFTPPIRILGFLPMVEDLSRPTMHLLSTIFPGTLAVGDVNREEWHRPCGKIIIITQDKDHLHPDHYLSDRALYLIGAGSPDRVALIVEAHRKAGKPIGGFILTCGDTTPLEDRTVLTLEQEHIPAIYVPFDTATVREKIEDVYENPKLQIQDIGKVAKIQELFEEYFFWDLFCETMDI